MAAWGLTQRSPTCFMGLLSKSPRFPCPPGREALFRICTHDLWLWDRWTQSYTWPHSVLLTSPGCGHHCPCFKHFSISFWCFSHKLVFNALIKKKKKKTNSIIGASHKYRISIMCQVLCRALYVHLKPPNNPLRIALPLCWPYRGGNRGSERLSVWLRVTLRWAVEPRFVSR